MEMKIKLAIRFFLFKDILKYKDCSPFTSDFLKNFQRM